MFTIPKKISGRIEEGLKKYKRVIANAQKKDLNESDTVTIITDIFADVLGYDKYTEVTSEYAISKTFCDLAIKAGSKLKLLVECKAIGVSLKNEHVRQAIDYGTKEGIPWIVLTNGSIWKVFKISFNRKPVTHDLIFEFALMDLNARNTSDIEKLYPLCREGMLKSKTALDEVYEHQSTVNKYMIGQLILDESTISHLRRLLKKVSPDIKVDPETISDLLSTEVLKRDALDPENTRDVRRVLKRKLGSPIKKVSKNDDGSTQPKDAPDVDHSVENDADEQKEI